MAHPEARRLRRTPVEDFAYPLPDAAIAQVPLEPRDAARLLVDRGPRPAARRPGGPRPARPAGPRRRAGGQRDPGAPGPAPGRQGHRRRGRGPAARAGARRAGGGRWSAPVDGSRPGTVVTAGDLAVEVGEDVGDGVAAGSRSPGGTASDSPVADLAGRAGGAGRGTGEVPLPPYVHTSLADPERYQTVYARLPGSVAAPTAGLHLTDRVLDGCRERGVRDRDGRPAGSGLGTFRPMDRRRSRTTACTPRPTGWPPRCSTPAAPPGPTGGGWSRWAPPRSGPWRPRRRPASWTGRTDIFIHGDHPFALVDRLLTNFHPPLVAPRPGRRLRRPSVAGPLRPRPGRRLPLPVLRRLLPPRPPLGQGRMTADAGRTPRVRASARMRRTSASRFEWRWRGRR